MAFTLPALPYAIDALAPHISRETLEYHYGKHHQAYVNKLNALVANTDYAGQSLEQIMEQANGAIFNNAAQVWNHTFYWHSMSPTGGGEPSGELATRLCEAFDSIQQFRESFTNTAIAQFGSGWTWLVINGSGKLEIVSTANADNPVTAGKIPLLTCDVWEHAYYIDTRNDRPKYINNFWALVNWEFASENLKNTSL